jgi:hypothetical protein
VPDATSPLGWSSPKRGKPRFLISIRVAGDSGGASEVSNEGLLSGIAHGFTIANSHSTSLPWHRPQIISPAVPKRPPVWQEKCSV